MGHWYGTKIGIRVKDSDEELSQQLLTILGVNMIESDMIEEIGALNDLDNYTADGLIEGDLAGIMPSLEKQFSDYQKQFSSRRCRTAGQGLQLDDLFQVVRKVFPRSGMYLAHEEGNDTSDSFFRYEAVYSSGKKKEANCFYSYGEGIHVSTDDPVEEGLEKREEKIPAQKPDEKLVRLLIQKAETEGFDNLARRLKGEPAASENISDRGNTKRIQKIPGLKVVNGIVVSYTGSDNQLEIPEGITEIGNGAFQGRFRIKSIKLPQSLIRIGETAFKGCWGMEAITIPNNVKHIGGWAFSSCEGLKEVVIPGNVECIEGGTFFTCKSLENVAIPSGVTEIGYSAFESCKGLKVVEIPETVKTIDDQAFFGCEKLASVKLPSGLTKIGSMVFEKCTGLSELLIPESVSSSGSRLVSENTEIHITNLEAWLRMTAYSGSPLINGAKLYVNGEFAENLVVPSGVTRICGNVFTGYKHLVSVTIPDTVTDIEPRAFAACPKLRKAVVPKALEEIVTNRGVFLNCKELAEIVYC